MNDSYALGNFPISPAFPDIQVALLHFPFSSLKSLLSGCQTLANRPAPLSAPVLFQIWGIRLVSIGVVPILGVNPVDDKAGIHVPQALVNGMQENTT